MEEITCSLHNYTKFSGITELSHYDIAQSALECGIDAVLTADRNVSVKGLNGFFYKAGKWTLLLSGTENFDPLDNSSPRTLSVDFSSENASVRERRLLKIIEYNSGAENSFYAQSPSHKELFTTQDLLKRGFYPSVEEIHKRLAAIDKLWNNDRRPVILAGNCGSFLNEPIRYPELFSSVANHLFIPNALSGEIDADAAVLYDALKTGRLFIAFDGLQSAKGFAFHAVGDNDEEPAYPGETIFLRNSVTLKIRVPEKCRCRLIYNGEVLREWVNASSMPYTAYDPGVYRVECAIEHNRRWLDWIFTNPIYVVRG